MSTFTRTLYVALVPRPDHLQTSQRRRQAQQVDEARVAGDGDAPRAPVARNARFVDLLGLPVPLADLEMVGARH